MSLNLKKGLSLCIIVGPGEAFELKRCLESVKGDLFDEICVTVTSDDEEVKEVAEDYADKVSYFEWCHDFGKARNYSFSQATCEHIMWLDADDVVKEESYEALKKFKKEKLHNHDMVLIDYIYAHDAEDNPIVILPRERIVKNCDYISWHDPIHEYLEMSNCKSIYKLEEAKVDHYRMKPFNPERNLSILKEQYEKPEPSPRTKFYYGKELMDTGDWAKGLEVLEEYINKGDGYRDNLTVASIKVSRHYFSENDLDKSKTFAMKGIGFNPGYAENFVVLGDIHQRRGDFPTAIKYYEDALTKKTNAGMSQLVDFYTFLPSANLALIYMNIGDYKNSLKYAERALKYKPDHDQIKEVFAKAKNEINRRPLNPTIKNMEELVRVMEDMGYDISVESNTERFADIRLYAKTDISVTWLVPAKIELDPATRIRRINVDSFLRKNGIDSKIVYNYHQLGKPNVKNLIGDSSIVVFVNHGELELELIKELKEDGKRILFDKCEAIFDYPNQNECMSESDIVLCCSTKLAEISTEKGFSNVDVIFDSVEKYEPRPAQEYEDRYERPKALYMGMGGNSFLAKEHLKPAIEEAGYDLVVITEWEDADKKWGLDTWASDMRECDVVLCPQRVDVQPAKSSIKAVTAMALGMPVICSPLQAYTEIIEDKTNGFICDKVDEWTEALKTLKDPKIRAAIGARALVTASAFQQSNIVHQYKKLFTDMIKNEKSPIDAPQEESPESNFKEPVDLIITNYNNVEYLKLFVSSILMNTLHPFHIIISDAGSNEETWEYLRTLKGITVLGDPDTRLNFSQSCNAGIAASRSKYFAILNSDLVVSKGWLSNIVDKMDREDRLAACGVLSNCDRGWLHDNPHNPNTPRYEMNMGGMELVPGMKIDQIKPRIDELYDFMDTSNKRYKGKFLEQPWVAAYATVFARSAVNEVGLFDPQYQNGCEDLDLCRRITSFGYRIGQAIDSFVYHFGGISRGAYQDENREEYDKEDKLNHYLYHEKWKQKKIVIWTGPAWEPWTKKEVDKGMAGSETWAAYLAIAFARRGYGVVIYNHLPEEDQDVYLKEEYEVDDSLSTENRKVEKGYVAYRHYTNMEEDLKYDLVDYFISSRTVDTFRAQIHAARRYVMIHDIWLNQDKNYDILSWKTDGYGYLSEWHKEFLKNHHSMPEDKMFLTANGVNFELYKDVDKVEKKNQIVYSSSPDRGLYELLLLFPKMREVLPDLTLIVAYGFYNWESAVKARGDEAGMAFIKKIKDAMDQPGVVYVDRIPKDKLAHYQMESKWWFYPTWFSETFCIGSVENGLAKNAILSSNFAGLTTTVGSAGILIDGDSHSEEYQEKFLEEAKKLLTDEEYTKEWSEKSYKKMTEYSWDNIAEGWMRQFGAL
jgi:GT2 family glycosyltransferase/tetratricopeptide (TPR) repeat protein